MPPKFVVDVAGMDLDKIAYDQEEIRKCNPQRGHMEMLNAIVYADPSKGQLVGYKNVRADEFWVDGHIPGRPLFPGVLMIECAAQLASFYTRKFVGWKGFIGFGGADEVKFRMQVSPGQRFYVLGQLLWERHKRIQCRIHGMVEGNFAFECLITS